MSKLKVEHIFNKENELSIWDGYGSWLLYRVGYQGVKGYSKLFEELHNIRFVWLIDMDENRAADGMKLRREYWESMSGRYGTGFINDIPCSFLEMLIGLAIRLDLEWVGNSSDPRPDIIFYDMIDNMGLTYYTNNCFDAIEVCEICGKTLHRKFLRNGRGGLFPLKKPMENQRNVEIWNQAMAYISEKYV